MQYKDSPGFRAVGLYCVQAAIALVIHYAPLAAACDTLAQPAAMSFTAASNAVWASC